MEIEPQLHTEPRLAAVEAELRCREPIFHKPELASARADLEAQTAADFWEVGASGSRYSREYVIETVLNRGPVPGESLWETSGFHCRELGTDTYALTYTLRQAERSTRRLTLWRRTPTGWQILYHQGTVVQSGPAGP
jgi:hypothetical protein